MSKYKRVNRPIGKDRIRSVRSQRRAEPDLELLARVVVELAHQQVAKDIQRAPATERLRPTDTARPTL